MQVKVGDFQNRLLEAGINLGWRQNEALLRRQRFDRALAIYGARNIFSQEDIDEATEVATSGDLEGWTDYLQRENAKTLVS